MEEKISQCLPLVKWALSAIALCTVLIGLSFLGNRELSVEKLEVLWPQKKFDTIKLSDGLTHYDLRGRSEDPLVVMVHGVSGPMTVWENTVPFLNQHGMQTLRYDLYGRGFSARLNKTHDLQLYYQQLDELVSKMAGKNSIILVGSSFGCVIASEYAYRKSNKVKGVVLIGPAGFPINVPSLAKLRDVPLLGDFLFWIVGKKTIMEQNYKYFVDENSWTIQQSYFKDQLNVRGTDWSILSTMRNSPVQAYSEGYKSLGSTSSKVGVIWGDKDQTFPHFNHSILKKQLPKMELKTIKNSAHLPHLEKPREVNPLILNFIVDFLNPAP